MTFRVDTAGPRALSFTGLLDTGALPILRARCAAVGCTRLVLRAGTEVAPECIAPLLELGLELVAESSYLARWLGRAKDSSGR